MKLEQILKNTRTEQYAVGSFSPRYTLMIKPVLEAAREANSPVIVQISQKEFDKYGVCAGEFAEEYFRQKRDLGICVPTTLHLDHTKDFAVIKEAIEAGFESVMIDASEKNFSENTRLSRQVAEYAHARGVSVEAELGRIGSTDMVETDHDEEMYTDPEEAKRFVEAAGIDALAVSVGTAHGVYTVKAPRINLSLVGEIRRQTPVYLVLHGGSGVPCEMVKQSYLLPGGGVSKVNIATDLEAVFLQSLAVTERMDDAWSRTLSAGQQEIGQKAVKELVADRMTRYLHSADKAWQI